jgi:hypothetical protein
MRHGFVFWRIISSRTRRQSREKEDQQRGSTHEFVDLAEFEVAGVANGMALWTGVLEKPTGGSEKPTGGSGNCDCPSIKNYPRDKFNGSEDEEPPPE